MNLRQLIANFKMPPDNHYGANWDENLSEALHLSHVMHYMDWDKFGERLSHVPIAPWYCTDTWVGLYFYVLDEEVVAVSMQTGRKNHQVIEFVSQEAFDKILAYAKDCLTGETPVVPMANLDEDFGAMYQVGFAEQVLCPPSQKILYEGQLVKPIRQPIKDVPRYGQVSYNHLLIQRDDGTEVYANIEKCLLPFWHVTYDFSKDAVAEKSPEQQPVEEPVAPASTNPEYIELDGRAADMIEHGMSNINWKPVHLPKKSREDNGHE